MLLVVHPALPVLQNIRLVSFHVHPALPVPGNIHLAVRHDAVEVRDLEARVGKVKVGDLRVLQQAAQARRELLPRHVRITRQRRQAQLSLHLRTQLSDPLIVPGMMGGWIYQ
jgi:hypothetical protein